MHNPFYAAFGTTRSAFSCCDVPKGRIFVVNADGELESNNASYKTTFQDLYVGVDVYFPDVRGVRNSQAQDTFNIVQFWKVPLPALDDI